MKKSLEDSNRILVYRLGSLGDTLVALPAFHAIREKFPHAEITILTSRLENSIIAPLETILPKRLFNNLIFYPLQTRNIIIISNLIKNIRKKNFDLVINLTANRGLIKTFRDLLLFKICRIPNLLGFSFSSKDLVLQKKQGDFYEPERERIFRRIKVLTKKSCEDESLWDLLFTEEEKQTAESILNNHGIAIPFLSVSLGSQFEEKKWQPSNWSKTIEIIHEKYSQLQIVALGAKNEESLSREILSPITKNYINLCGKTNPRISALIIKQSILFMGHDSGPMHLAATVGTPCLSIFSLRNKKGHWYPRGTSNVIFYPNTKKREGAIQTIDPKIVGEQTVLKINELLKKT